MVPLGDGVSNGLSIFRILPGTPCWTHEWSQHAKMECQEATHTCLIQAGMSGS